MGGGRKGRAKDNWGGQKSEKMLEEAHKNLHFLLFLS